MNREGVYHWPKEKHGSGQARQEKHSAGGRVNAAGSEVGLPVPGLSNRSPHPPASNGVRGRTKKAMSKRVFPF